MKKETNNEWIEMVEKKVIEYANNFRASDERAFFRKALNETAIEVSSSEHQRLREKIKRALETYFWDMELDSDPTICVMKNRRALNDNILKLLE